MDKVCSEQEGLEKQQTIKSVIPANLPIGRQG